MPSGGLKGVKTLLTAPRKIKTPTQDPGLELDFESLLRDQDVPAQLRDKLRLVDDSVKQAFLTSFSCPARPPSPRKHTRTQSKGFLSPTKKTKVIDHEMEYDEPVQFIRYLSTRVPQKTRIEIVKRLRLLLRSQRIIWMNDFVALSGARALYLQIAGIVKIEWREEHEDQLLSELLGCVQSMCTSTAGIEKLDGDFLQSIVNLLFSEKQPSDYRCRGQIMNILQCYLTAKDDMKSTRATQVLMYLSDPIKPLSERPLEMLERAHTPRPYKRWMSELEKPVRDCFWIFLHSDNLIPIISDDECASMVRRKPIVPEGYVGGVEWIAVEYICTHLSLINALLDSLLLPDRLALRRHLRTSHFEKICGYQLRRASTKFYTYLHEELKIWACKATLDDWKTTTVTSGTARDDSHVVTSTNAIGGAGSVGGLGVRGVGVSRVSKDGKHRRTQSSLLPELHF